MANWTFHDLLCPHETPIQVNTFIGFTYDKEIVFTYDKERKWLVINQKREKKIYTLSYLLAAS